MDLLEQFERARRAQERAASVKRCCAPGNEPSRVFVARAGRHALTTTILTTAQVQELVERTLKSSGRRVDLSQPFVDAMLPEGHRLHVALEGISRGFAAVNLRKFVLRAPRLTDLRARQPDSAGGKVPRGSRAGRSQHRDGRRHAGGKADNAQRQLSSQFPERPPIAVARSSVAPWPG